jgi:hypothetical protein
VGPAAVGIKTQVYALACSALLGHLKDLRLATQDEKKYDYSKCLSSFDSALSVFFNGSLPSTFPEAVHVLREALRGPIAGMRSINKSVAGIFEEVSEELIAGGTFDITADLDRFHRQGRELSARMFARSCKDTAEQLKRECEIVMESIPDDDETLNCAAFPLGHGCAPLAFVGENRRQSGVGARPDRLVIRFNKSHLDKKKADRGFRDYLFYPFGFLHEYSAHVHARDYGSERFNDGWMVYAAALFLETNGSAAEQIGLDWDQITIYRDHVYPHLNPIPKRACQFTERFRHFLSNDNNDNKFWDLTYQLASFEPERNREENRETWHDMFINALESGLEKHPRSLLEAIARFTDVRRLFAKISVF